MGQQCGKTWINTFGKINGMYNSSTQLPLAQLVTWNDYEEGTEIESGIDNCLTVGASLSGTATALVSGTTLNFSPQGTGSESATVDHYRVFVSSDGSHLMNLTDLPVGARSLNLGSYSFGPGTYYFFVKMWGRATIRNKTSGSVKYTVTGVVIKSPVSGSTVSNSVHVTATATAVRTPVKVMQIYLDGSKVYEILNTSTLDHYITASSGRWHQIVVQAYDTNYYYFNSSANVYVP
jgi:Bacterial Ig domain